jgi:hypothetical protein
VWVLTTRRVLFGRDGIVAGRLAVTFTTVFVIGAVTLGYVTDGSAARAAATMGLGLVAGSVFLLVRAHRRVARLTTRRAHARPGKEARVNALEPRLLDVLNNSVTVACAVRL